MPSLDVCEPVTVAAAVERLGKSAGTIRCWASRYSARKLGVHRGRTVYDYGDLATIEACIFRGDPVPGTPEERDVLRASYRDGA